MKKAFLLFVVLLAGMVVSCSSTESSGDEPQKPKPNAVKTMDPSQNEILISFSFHNHHSVLLTSHLSVKGEFCTSIVLRQSGETAKEPTALITAPFTLS